MLGGMGGGTVVVEVVGAASGAPDMGTAIDGGGGGRDPCMPTMYHTVTKDETVLFVMQKYSHTYNSIGAGANHTL